MGMTPFQKKFFLLKIALGIMLFLVFFVRASITDDPDLGWHIAVGKWVVENKAIPHGDIYSHTMPGFEWVDHEWLIETFMWWGKSHGVFWLVVLFFAVISFLPFAYWIKRSKSLSYLWVVSLVAIAMLSFVGTRPQTISIFLFFVFFELARRKYAGAEPGAPRDSKKTLAYFWILPTIFFAWANLHAGVINGLAVFAIFIIAEYAPDWKNSLTLRNRDFLKDALLYFLCFTTTLINPYGWKIYELVFSAVLSPEAMNYLMEWQSIFFISKGAFAPLMAFSIFLFLAFTYFGKYPRTLLSTSIILAALFMKTAKSGPHFFAAALPLIELGDGYFREKIASANRTAELTKKTRMISARVGTLLYAAIFISGTYFLTTYGSLAASALSSGKLVSALPEKALEALRDKVRLGEIQNLFNTYHFGGAMVLGAPEAKIFIDGRMAQWVDKDGDSAM